MGGATEGDGLGMPAGLLGEGVTEPNPVGDWLDTQRPARTTATTLSLTSRMPGDAANDGSKAGVGAAVSTTAVAACPMLAPAGR